MADRRYVRIPADSTGKRVLLRGSYDVPYINRTLDIQNDDRVTISGSNSQLFTGVVVKVKEDNATDGVISLMLDQTTIDQETVPVAGNNIIIDGQAVATVQNVGYDIFSNAYNLVSYDDPYNGQLVDERGAAYMRFSEGSPQLDSFGRLRVSNTTTLGNYVFNFNRLSVRFSDLSVAPGLIDHSTQQGCVILQSDGTVGADAVYQSNVYHYYKPGTSQLIRCTLACSDSGKTNITRRWGYYSSNDGVFFELEDDVLYVVIRSSVSGVVTETKVPQSEWNVDRVDGGKDVFNKSYVSLDVSKINLYWIDMQWNGRIRMGIDLNGGRIVCHEFFDANSSPLSTLRQPNLPFRVEQLDGGAGSTSEMRVWAAGVHNESLIDFHESSVHITHNIDDVTVSGADTLVASIRPELSFFTINNTNVLLLDKMSVSSFDASGNPVPVKIEIMHVIFPGTGVTGGTWVNADNASIVPGYNVSSTEVNTTATWTKNGFRFATFYVDGIADQLDLTHSTTYEQSPVVKWENGIQPETIIVATPLSATTPIVNVSLTWREIG